MADNKLRIGVLGASGYTGSDLVRLAARHPNIEITALTANSHACLLYTSPSPRDKRQSRMPSSA